MNLSLAEEEEVQKSFNKVSNNSFIDVDSSVHSNKIDKSEYNNSTHYHHLNHHNDDDDDGINLDDNLLMDDFLLNNSDLLFNNHHQNNDNTNNDNNDNLDLYNHDYEVHNNSSSYDNNNIDYPNLLDDIHHHHDHHGDDNNFCDDLFPTLKECVFDDDFDNFFLNAMNNDENISNHETIDIVNNDNNHHHDFYSNYDYDAVDLDFNPTNNSDMYNNHLVLSKPAEFFQNTTIYQHKLSIDDRSGNGSGSKSSRGKSNNSVTKSNTKTHNDKQQILSGKRSFDDSIGKTVVS